MELFSSESKDNFTPINSCVLATVPNTTGTILPASVAIPARVIQILGLCLTVVGTLLNALILFLVAKHKKLRTVSFAIAVQLAVVHLITSFNYVILTISVNKAYYGNVNPNHCTASGFTLHTLFILRTFLIFVFSLDRFLLVFMPFYYPKHQSKLVIVLSVLAYVISISFNTINLPGILDCFFYVEDALLCIIGSKCHFHCKVLFYTF